MGRPKRCFRCRGCAHVSAQWVGRCPACGEWGTLEPEAVAAASGRVPVELHTLAVVPGDDRRLVTGVDGLDRVVGGGFVPGSVVLLAGEPGIGKSTLVLHLVASLASAGHRCVVASGEESRSQVAARAYRLGVPGDDVVFVPGRDLATVVQAVLDVAPAVLVVDSIQSLRDDGPQLPGGVAQARHCTDVLVGLANELGVVVVLTGHVTKDGDLAGPRALEHAVDVVLTFDGDPRAGLRVLAAGKDRFGAEGETAWFEMGPKGLRGVDPSSVLLSGVMLPGAAVALPVAGRRAFAVEVQALVGGTERPSRRQVTGLDSRRFQLVAAVLEQALQLPLGRAELYGAVPGGVRIDDPACDLAVAAALTSALNGVPAPAGAAFVGELSLTGMLRPAPGVPQRLRAATGAAIEVVYAPADHLPEVAGLQVVPVRRLHDALQWALPPAATRPARLPA